MDEEELRKQREEVTAIVKMRVAGTASGTQVPARVWVGLCWLPALLPRPLAEPSLSCSMPVTSSAPCTWRRRRWRLNSMSRWGLLSRAGRGPGTDGHFEMYGNPQRHSSLHLGAQRTRGGVGLGPEPQEIVAQQKLVAHLGLADLLLGLCRSRHP